MPQLQHFIERAADDFEREACRNPAPQLEAFWHERLKPLDERTAAAVRGPLLAQLILVEIDARRRHEPGYLPAAAEYRARFPDHHDDVDFAFLGCDEQPLERQFEALRTELAERLRAITDGLVRQLEQGRRPRIGKYEVDRVLGQGGMGVVFHATDTKLRREVAIKVPRLKDGATIAPHLRSVLPLWEARRQVDFAQHDSDRVVIVHEVFGPLVEPDQSADYVLWKLVRHLRTDTPLAVVMEYLADGSLAQRLQEHGVMPPRDAALLIADVAEALGAAHERRLLHRDLKPANILLHHGRPKLADFGLAIECDRQRLDECVGTPAYMAPDLFERRGASPSSDIWSLGAILFELLTGQRLFPQATVPEVVDAICHAAPQLPRTRNRAVPEELSTICGKCLAREPSHRFHHATDLAEALRAAVRREPPGDVAVRREPPGESTSSVPAPDGLRRAAWDAPTESRAHPVADFERLTTLARQRLAERADTVLREQCGGSYVLSHLSLELPGDPAEPSLPGERTKHRLEPDQVRAVVLGNGVLGNGVTRRGSSRDADHDTDRPDVTSAAVPDSRRDPRAAPRYWLRAHSGMGKSTLLAYAEREIARDEANRLPLRLGAGPLPLCQAKRLPLLSECPWNADRIETVLHWLDERLLSPLVPGEDKAARFAWFAWLVQQGRVVFLLDALDQTKAELEGLGSFFGAAELAACPVLLTGRPEAEQTQSDVFGTAPWQPVVVEEFDLPQQRQFLGAEAENLLREVSPVDEFFGAYLRGESLEANGQILPQYAAVITSFVVNGEFQRDQFNSALVDYSRRQQVHDPRSQWQELLKVPLLLMKQLAVDDDLKDLSTRESVYDRALTGLIVKGLKTLGDSEHRGALENKDAVKRLLEEIAWATVTSGPTGIAEARVEGDAFRALEERLGDKLNALAQVDVTTLTSLFDEPGFTGLAWRHRSFCEYFAGVWLARQSREKQRAIVQQESRPGRADLHDPAWAWFFRFALACAYRDEAQRERWFGTPTARQMETARYVALATDLIRFGNPFLVYDAMEHEQLPLPDELRRLCCWLVHRDYDWSQQRDYRTAWKPDERPLVLTDRVLDILEDYFQPAYRNSRCLHAAWELLTESAASQVGTEPVALRRAQRARQIAGGFRAEFPAWLQDDGPSGRVAVELRDGFERCPRNPIDDRQPFQQGSPDGVGEAHEHPQHWVELTPFYAQRFPVTNAQYELFDPGHRFLRDRFSADDDQPVIWVNWYMAVMFCRWLGPQYRLPTEAEWEYFCRAGTTTEFAFGDELTSELANFNLKVGHTTPAGTYAPNAWGLYDTHGNVWEWTADWYAPDYYEQLDLTPAIDPQGPSEGSSRGLRGGSWYYGPAHCRCALRDYFDPTYRDNNVGFRLLCVPCPSFSSSSS